MTEDERKAVNKMIEHNRELTELLVKCQKTFESITCNCAEGPEVFDRKTLMGFICKEAMEMYDKIEKAIGE